MADNLAMRLYKNVYRTLEALQSISERSKEYANQYDKLIDVSSLMKSKKLDEKRFKKVLIGLKNSTSVLDKLWKNLEIELGMRLDDTRFNMDELIQMVKDIKIEDQLELDFDKVPLGKLKEKN